MWFLVILNALAKNIIPLIRQKYMLIRQKSFLEENKERGNEPVTSPTEGGSGGHPPRHSHVPPSPPKARAKQFSLILLPV